MATLLAEGDACSAKEEAEALRDETIEAVNARAVPEPFQEELLATVQEVADGIECLPPPAPAPPPPAPPPAPPPPPARTDEDEEDEDEGEKDKQEGKGRGKGKGRGDREEPGRPDDVVPPVEIPPADVPPEGEGD